MDTQIIESGNKNKNRNNGKSEILKKGAALTGAAVARACAMYGANVIMDGDEIGDKEMELEVPIVEIEDPVNPNPSNSTETAEEQHHTTPATPHHNSDEPGPQGNDDPTTGGGGSSEIVEPQTDPEIISPEEIDDTVEKITGEDYIDATDIDAPNLDITSIGTITTADGQELAAAQILSDTGDELYVVDVDSDNVYDYLADANGNVISGAGTLTVGDAEVIITENDGEAGYLANNDNDGMTDDLLMGIEDDIMDINA